MLPRHPAIRLACWLLAVLAVQSLSGACLALAFGFLPLLGRAALLRFRRLVWRTRWLVVSLFLVLGWGMAGEPVAEGGGWWLPTVEGLAFATTHLARLLLVLAAVAALLESTPLASLMAGCHVLLRPLRFLRLDVDRAVVRLALALHYAEGMRGRDWRNLLDPAVTATGPASVTLSLPSARLLDWCGLLLAGAALVLAVSV